MNFVFLIKLLISIFSIVILTSVESLSAPAMLSSVCEIEGQITNITVRTHEYKSESWRKSWNLPKAIHYTDVKIDLKKISLKEQNYGECSLNAFKNKTFQVRKDIKINHLKQGTCIVALTQYSGDEFSIGQWIWNITLCKKS